MTDLGPRTLPLLDEPIPAGGAPSGDEIRVWLHPLGGQQREAIVFDGANDEGWRIFVDEGKMLGGTGLGPSPLSNWSAGIASTTVVEVLREAAIREISVGRIEISLDVNFRMKFVPGEGRRSWGEAANLDVRVTADADEATVADLVTTARSNAPVASLYAQAMPNEFRSTRDGADLSLDLHHWASPPAMLTSEEYGSLDIDADFGSPMFTEVELDEGPGPSGGPQPGGEGMLISLHTEASWQPGAVVDSRVTNVAPPGPTWSILNDVPPELGGSYRAPSARASFAAGVILCFGSHLNTSVRQMEEGAGYTAYQEVSLDRDADGKVVVSPFRTNVEWSGPVDDETATAAVIDAEATCFIHATCREPVAIDTP